MKPFRIPETTVQSHIVQALRNISAGVYVLGRPGLRERRCPHCGHMVKLDPGTRQTPGVSDLLAFLPDAPRAPFGPGRLVCVEVKAQGGVLSEDQKTFRNWCERTSTSYLTGGLDVVLEYLKQGGYLREYASYRQPRS